MPSRVPDLLHVTRKVPMVTPSSGVKAKGIDRALGESVPHLNVHVRPDRDWPRNIGKAAVDDNTSQLHISSFIKGRTRC